MTAHKDASTPCSYDGTGAGYTAGGMNTGSDGVLFKSKFGTFETRMRISCDAGTGVWNTAWASGAEPGMSWPADGEIDWIETLKDLGADRGASTLHGQTGSGGHWQKNVGTGPVMDCQSYHLIRGEWAFGKISTYYDNILIGTVTREQLAASNPTWMWPFDSYPERLILEMSLGSWGGTINDATIDGQTQVHDWVRVIQ